MAVRLLSDPVVHILHLNRHPGCFHRFVAESVVLNELCAPLEAAGLSRHLFRESAYRLGPLCICRPETAMKILDLATTDMEFHLGNRQSIRWNDLRYWDVIVESTFLVRFQSELDTLDKFDDRRVTGPIALSLMDTSPP